MEERRLDPSNPFAQSSGEAQSSKRKPTPASSKRRASYDDAASRTGSSFSSGARNAPFDERTTSGHTHTQPRTSLESDSVATSQRGLTQAGPSEASVPRKVPYAGTFAPNPSFIRLLRFALYGLSSLSALVTAGFAISVVAYYNARQSIKPSWGSLIALIVFGIITPGAYFGTFLVTPRLFRYGSFAGIVNQVRTELLMLFALDVIWVSGALAMAADLRGYENCIWDTYFHYERPSNFHHVCDLINTTVIMGYLTFGLVTLTWAVVTFLAIYILLYLDQEVLSELTNDMGGRAYRARTYALALQQQRNAQAYYGSEKQMTEGSRPYSEKTPSHRRTASYAGTATARPIEPAENSRGIPSEAFYGRPRSVRDDATSEGSGDGPMMAMSERERSAWNRDMREA